MCHRRMNESRTSDMANHGSYNSLIDLTYTSCDAGGIQELNSRGRGYSVESTFRRCGNYL